LKALPLSRAAGDYQYEALLLLATGRAYYHQSNYQKAIEHFNTALSISRPHGFTEGKGIALGGFGLVYEKGGDYQKALDHFGVCLVMEHFWSISADSIASKQLHIS
jgi:tetratricopeptide (TPR) repeat protein